MSKNGDSNVKWKSLMYLFFFLFIVLYLPRFYEVWYFSIAVILHFVNSPPLLYWRKNLKIVLVVMILTILLLMIKLTVNLLV